MFLVEKGSENILCFFVNMEKPVIVVFIIFLLLILYKYFAASVDLWIKEQKCFMDPQKQRWANYRGLVSHQILSSQLASK